MKQALNLKILVELLVMVGWVEQLRFEKGFLKIAKNLILEGNSGDSDHFSEVQKNINRH